VRTPHRLLAGLALSSLLARALSACGGSVEPGGGDGPTATRTIGTYGDPTQDAGGDAADADAAPDRS